MINMESWEVNDLKEIAKVGFEKLGIQIEDNVATQIAVESLSSPQLMQYICLNICTILEMSGRDAWYVKPEILKIGIPDAKGSKHERKKQKQISSR